MRQSCFLRALTAACTLPALVVLFASSDVSAATPVTLGVVTWIGYGPIYCAAANGYYRKYGLDVKLVNFTDNSVIAGAVQSGEISATTLTYDQVIASNARSPRTDFPKKTSGRSIRRRKAWSESYQWR